MNAPAPTKPSEALRVEETPEEIQTIRMRVFEHTRGRFVFPSMGYIVEDDLSSPATIGFDAMMWAMNTGCKDTGEWFEASVCNGVPFGFDGWWGTVSGPIFRHGGGSVIFISGPLFNEATAKHEAAS